VSAISSSQRVIRWQVAELADLFNLGWAETDILTAVHDLQDPSRTGPWTISHPVYTPEVSRPDPSHFIRELYMVHETVADGIGVPVLQELRSVKVVRRETVTLSDKLAAGLVKLSR
jgi:hypothetical protein